MGRRGLGLSRQRTRSLDVYKEQLYGGLSDDKSSKGIMYLVVRK